MEIDKSNFEIIKSKLTGMIEVMLNGTKFINDELICRNSKITYRDVFCHMILMYGLKLSSRRATNIIKEKLDIQITQAGIIKKKDNLEPFMIQKLNDNILKHIYDSDQRRIFAVDATFLHYDMTYVKQGYHITQNKVSTKSSINCVFDVQNKIPIDYFTDTTMNERSAFLKQIESLKQRKLIKQNDLFIFDAGYYRYDIIQTICETNTDFILRIPMSRLSENNQWKIKNNNSIIIKIENNKKKFRVRLIKYKILNKERRTFETVYIFTSLKGVNYSVNTIKELYHKRWEVETHFRYAKYSLCLDGNKARTPKGEAVRLLMNQLIFIICSYILFLLQKYIGRENYKFNMDGCLDMVCRSIIPSILYGKNNTNIENELTFNIVLENIMKKVMNSVCIISEDPIYLENDRTFPRITKTPKTKFGPNGTSYGNLKRKEKIKKNKEKQNEKPKREKKKKKKRIQIKQKLR